jgi:hypothetical protein
MNTEFFEMMFTTSNTNSQPAKGRTNIPKCIDKSKVLLPIDYVPSEYSIICGNKRNYFNSPGNCRLRVIVQSCIVQYGQADGKLEKGRIVSNVMNMIRDACPVGAFVAFENNRWWQVSERTSREKVGSYFRDCLGNKYASSAKNKIARRKTRREETKKQPQVNTSSVTTTMPEQVASLVTFQLKDLQAIESTDNLFSFTDLVGCTLPTAQHQFPNLMQQQQQQQQQQEQHQQQFVQQFIPKYNFILDDEDSISTTSGTTASFYDVDDLSPVPLLEL